MPSGRLAASMAASGTNQLPSFAAAASSNVFTFTANTVKPISVDGRQLNKGTDDSSTIMKTSGTPIVPLRLTFNAAAPANHLPTELVVKVLTSGAWSHWSELVALTHICQHWRNVALGTPQLWADAVQSGLFSGRWPYQCLPIFLERSVPCPLSIELRCLSSFTEELEYPGDYPILQPHLSRVTRLTAQILDVTEFVNFVRFYGLRMRNIERMHMPWVKREPDFAGLPLVIDRFWRDRDFPRLHTLTLSSYCFLKPIAVASLRTLILHDEPRNYDEFLTALARCAPGLESLAFCAWSHQRRASRTQNAATPTVHLPNLRHFRVSLSSQAQSIEPLTFLFTSLSFPPDVAIHVDWKCNPGIIRELLPKNIVGLLEAPPFFESMCLHLNALPVTATLHCYVDDTERLIVRERPLVSSRNPGKGRRFHEFLDEHRYTTVTQLALDLDMEPKYGHRLFASAGVLQNFVGALPRLRRLDLFGKAIGDVQLSVAETFLRLADPDNARDVPGKTLGYVCEVAEHFKSVNKVEYIGNVYAELDQLEQILKAHEATGGTRLHRLEVCVAYSSRDSHPSRRGYPSVQKVPPSTELTARVAPTYLEAFGALVDEVVFVGYIEKRGSGYRLLTGEERQPVSGPKRSDRGGKGKAMALNGRSGRKVGR